MIQIIAICFLCYSIKTMLRLIILALADLVVARLDLLHARAVSLRTTRRMPMRQKISDGLGLSAYAQRVEGLLFRFIFVANRESEKRHGTWQHHSTELARSILQSWDLAILEK